MDCYYINLESARKRKELIEAQIKSSNLSFQIKRFPALLGRDYEESKPQNLSFGQWGCWLSHIEVINQSLKNFEHLLIIEDDEFFDSSLEILNDISSKFDDDWDILYLDATFVEVFDYIDITRKAATLNTSEINIFELDKNSTPYGTHSYIINKKSKFKILELLNNNSRLGIPIDNVFCAAIKQQIIKAKILLPLLVSPGPETFDSQISFESHPLSNDWIKFRSIFCKINIGLPNNQKNELIIDIINSRNNFSLEGEFTPYNYKLTTNQEGQQMKEIFSNLEFRCDKFEHYFPVYEKWFSKFKGKSPRILEIGVQYGGSAEMWRKYFGIGTKVIGVDINPLCTDTDYLQVITGDQGSTSFWDNFKIQNISNFDIIIDDGSHDNPHQIATLKETYNLLNDGGIYWCEDTHTSYYHEVRVTDGGYLNKNSFIEYSKKLIDVIHSDHTHYAIGVGPTNGPHVDSSLVDLYQNIQGIHFYDSIVVIEKGPKVPFKRIINK